MRSHLYYRLYSVTCGRPTAPFLYSDTSVMGWMCVRAFLSSVRDPASFHPVLISASPLYVEKWIGVQHIPVPSPCL